MGTQTVSTDKEGPFRFPVVPVGEYTVVFALEGFHSVTQRVHVTIGFTVTVDVALEIATLKDSVIVERPASIVDRHSCR